MTPVLAEGETLPGEIQKLDDGHFRFVPDESFTGGVLAFDYSFKYKAFHTHYGSPSVYTYDYETLTKRRYLDYGSHVSINVTPLDEEHEESSIYRINGNWDDDNSNGIVDSLEFNVGDSEDDLFGLKVDLKALSFINTDLVPVSLQLHRSDGLSPHLRLWKDSSKSEPVLTGMYKYDEFPRVIYVEVLSRHLTDPTSVVIQTHPSRGSVKGEYSALLSVADSESSFTRFETDWMNYGIPHQKLIDLDIDSDNDGQIGVTEEEREWEEELEDSEYAFGKILYPTYTPAYDGETTQTPLPVLTQFTPMNLNLPAGLSDDYRIKFDYAMDATSAGQIKLWTKMPLTQTYNPNNPSASGRDGLLVSDSITSGVSYSLDDIGYNATSGAAMVYIDGISPTNINTLKQLDENGSPSKKITATLTNQDTGISSKDSVKYLVVRTDSQVPNHPKNILHQIEFREDLSAALSSNGVYGRGEDQFKSVPEDLPNYGLRLVSREELQEWGLNAAQVQAFNSSNGGGSGLKMALYQDYTRGPRDYILAFAGTDFETPKDWVSNILNGIRQLSPQYVYAVGAANKLFKVNTPSEGVIGKYFDSIQFAGHSLGGGLASAASVWTGGKAYTFNAAGLHIQTIKNLQYHYKFMETGSFDEYENQLSRYAQAGDYITAYYNESDILSTLQDGITILPSAIGTREILADPYSGDVTNSLDNDLDIRLAKGLLISKLNQSLLRIDPDRIFIIDVERLYEESKSYAAFYIMNYLINEFENNIFDVGHPDEYAGFVKMIENHGMYLYGLLDPQYFGVGNENIWGYGFGEDDE